MPRQKHVERRFREAEPELAGSFLLLSFASIAGSATMIVQGGRTIMTETMPLDALVDLLNRSVPFARHAAVEVVTADPGSASSSIPDAPFLRNHVGTQHAGALFTVGEAASGAVMAASLADLLETATPMVRQASVRYFKPARGEITASARFALDPSIVRDTFAGGGEADFQILVSLQDKSADEVAVMSIEWSLRRRES